MYYVGTIRCDPNYLQHDGQKGMKWGIRRYQNYDGTLTEAGKIRYRKGLSDKERARYNKYDDSARGIERSYDKMDKDFAKHYGKYKEHGQRFNEKMTAAWTRIQNKYGGDVAQGQKDKRVDKWLSQATDSLERGRSEYSKMKDIDDLQTERINKAVSSGFDVTLKEVDRSTYNPVGAAAASAIFAAGGAALGISTVKFAHPSASAKELAIAGSIGGFAGSGGYLSYKRNKGNPLSVVGRKATLTPGSGKVRKFDKLGREEPLTYEQEQAIKKSIRKYEQDRERDYVVHPLVPTVPDDKKRK